jgi:DNA primase
MTPEEFLTRLKGVKNKGKGKWMACCPAHDDSDPSMAISQTNSGKILVKCFAGCTALDIVHSVGLELQDLFPDAYQENPMAFAYRERAERERRKNKISYARTYCAILTSHLRKGLSVTQKEIDKGRRLKQFLVNEGIITG